MVHPEISAGLKQACPEGVFVSLTPGAPTLWSGVIFVRKGEPLFFFFWVLSPGLAYDLSRLADVRRPGPYATAILRFQISFPDTYPDLPPLVTFSTDMFHTLITPLTTYMLSLIFFC